MGGGTRRAAVGAGVSLGALLGAAGSAEAADYTVTNLADSGAGSLRDALGKANSHLGTDRVLFASRLSGTIRLNSRLVAQDAVQILGPGAGRLTLDGGAFTTLEVDYLPASAPVLVSGLTFTGASASGTHNGGAIAGLSGTLTVARSVITGNHAPRGGGIYSRRPLRVVDSTVSGNSASYPGGGIFSNDALLTIEGSTVSGNSSGSNGGGISGYKSDLIVGSSTIAGNHATGGYPGGGISAAGVGASASLTDTIVADNTHTGGNPDLYGPFDAAFSLIEDPSGNGNSVNQTGPNRIGVDPKLGPLANNGGPTKTQALLPGSPALDVGLATGTDQRGAPRPFDLKGIAKAPGGNSADIGAYERVLCAGVAVNRVGTAGKDKLVGTKARDGLLGLGGKDLLLGKAGGDALCGGGGPDILEGGKGRDKLLGQAGRDTLIGGPGRDRLNGGPGRDSQRQ